MNLLHKNKFDRYRMAARIERGKVQLLTRSASTGPTNIRRPEPRPELRVKSAYLDSELCGVRPDGVTAFRLIQQASDGAGGKLGRYYT